MATRDLVTVELEKELIEVLDDVSKTAKMSRGDIVRAALIEKLEDFYDIEQADKAYRNWLDTGKKTYSHAEALRRYG